MTYLSAVILKYAKTLIKRFMDWLRVITWNIRATNSVVMHGSFQHEDR